MAKLVEMQFKLLKEINEIANKAVSQAEIAEKNANIAKRHAIWANIIALLAIFVSAVLTIESI